MSQDPRYPIGRFNREVVISKEMMNEFISTIELLPSRLRTEVEKLSGEQLDTPYREGGWTIRQVVHHIPDSHMNAYMRFKLALTEDNPLIKTYKENLWAELKDTFETPIEVSLTLLEAMHKRWVILLRSLSDKQFERTLLHPDWGNVTLNQMLALYSWHSRHHFAHITELKRRRGW